VGQHTRVAAGSATPLIEPLRPDRLVQARDVLAEAFRDNPLNEAVIGADASRRLLANRHGMAAMLPVAAGLEVAHTASCGGRVVGVLVGSPPELHPLPPPSPRARLRCWLGQGWRVARRWAEVYELLSVLHPPEPHWYLGSLGVAPASQGRGIGGALLGEFLARVDRDALPAYLETDRAEAVRFYERAGFAVLAEIPVLDVPIWSLWRVGRRPAEA
jgi:ribosomal protein S18 acetylase RimI-like enzyme